MATRPTGRPIDTYERLGRHYQAWSKGDMQFLAVIGPPGLGKTYEYETLALTPCHEFRGKTSAVEMYRDAKDLPDAPIIFNDVRGLMRKNDCIDIMKQLCETKPRRTIRWKTNTHLIPREERQFECTSNVLVVLNSVPKNDPDVEAILDRFDVVEFRPSKAEIIARMRTFAERQGDVDLMANLPVDPSLRDLDRFERWCRAEDINEIEELLSLCQIPSDIQLMMQVLETTPPRKRLAAYRQLSGKTYEAAKRAWTRKWRTAQRLIMPRQSKKG